MIVEYISAPFILGNALRVRTFCSERTRGAVADRYAARSRDMKMMSYREFNLGDLGELASYEHLFKASVYQRAERIVRSRR